MREVGGFRNSLRRRSEQSLGGYLPTSLRLVGYRVIGQRYIRQLL